MVDPGSSEGDAGVKERPQTYMLPPARNYDQVDPEELDEYGWRKQPPMATLQISTPYIAAGKILPAGFYQIKLGQYDDGSPGVQLDPTLVAEFLKEQQARSAEAEANKKWYSWAMRDKKYVEDQFQTLVIKQAGKVLLVLPVESITPYIKTKGEKLPKAAQVWVDHDETPPQLKLYYKKMVFATALKASQ